MTWWQPLAGLLILASIPSASGCGRAPAPGRAPAAAAASDGELRERDAALLREIDAFTSRCAPTWPSDPECLEAACRLRARELDLFAEVRRHDFSDITESNYWHRGRLKFPGDLEQLFQRLPAGLRPSGSSCPPDGVIREPSSSG